MKLTGFFIFAAGVVQSALTLFLDMTAGNDNFRMFTEQHDFIIIGCTLVVCGAAFIVADIILVDLLAAIKGETESQGAENDKRHYCHCYNENFSYVRAHADENMGGEVRFGDMRDVKL